MSYQPLATAPEDRPILVHDRQFDVYFTIHRTETGWVDCAGGRYNDDYLLTLVWCDIPLDNG